MTIPWQQRFDEALEYSQFLTQYGQPAHRQRWQSLYEQVQLTAAQRELLASFRRTMNVLCLAGAWCGDCVNQCPILQRFAEASPAVTLRFLDRDACPDVRGELSINGGHRVPVVVFLSEDYFEVARYGERTLARYRQLAKELLGAACPTGIVPPGAEMTAAVAQDWLDEFERAQLILRLSPRLRQRYGD